MFREKCINKKLKILSKLLEQKLKACQLAQNALIRRIRIPRSK